MSYPGEDEHVEYLDYVERYSLGQEGNGPKMTKDQWRAMKKVKPKPYYRREKKETIGSLVDEDMVG